MTDKEKLIELLTDFGMPFQIRTMMGLSICINSYTAFRFDSVTEKFREFATSTDCDLPD